MTQSNENLAKFIDHTLLKPEATALDIERLCDEAKQHGFFSICINPSLVDWAAGCLEESQVKICTVVGFPLGAHETQIKVLETSCAVEQGAHEIDMVLNLGSLKSGLWNIVGADIAAVVEAAKGRTVKVILETALLNNEEKALACRVSKEAGAQFVKTSTGFGPSGATVEDIQLMRATVGPDFGVKASGGIRDHATAIKMIQAGATRLGTSAGIAIVTGGSSTNGQY